MIYSHSDQNWMPFIQILFHYNFIIMNTTEIVFAVLATVGILVAAFIIFRMVKTSQNQSKEIKRLTRINANLLFVDDVIVSTLSNEEIVKLQLFRDQQIIDFFQFQFALSKVLKRSVFLHEFSDMEKLRKEYLSKI